MAGRFQSSVVTALDGDSSSHGPASRPGSMPALAHGPCAAAPWSSSHGALSPVNGLPPPSGHEHRGAGSPSPLSPASRTGSHPNWVFSTFLPKERKSSQVTNVTPILQLDGWGPGAEAGAQDGAPHPHWLLSPQHHTLSSLKTSSSFSWSPHLSAGGGGDSPGLPLYLYLLAPQPSLAEEAAGSAANLCGHPGHRPAQVPYVSSLPELAATLLLIVSILQLRKLRQRG